MDSLIYQELRNEVNLLSQTKDNLDARIKELHEEEMRYLAEIPLYEKQAKEAKATHGVLAGKTVSMMAELENARKELVKVQGLVARENKSLEDLKETQKKIIEETKAMNEQIKQRHSELKQRELAVADREKASELREVGCKNKEFELDKRDVELVQQGKNIGHLSDGLHKEIEEHKVAVANHNKNVESLKEQRKFHNEDTEVLKGKLQKADKLVKDHINLKASLLLDKEKLAEAIKEVEQKRAYFEKQEQSLREREEFLKFKKMRFAALIEDAGLPKELKESLNKET